MDRYKRMAILATTVEAGSMTRAARELGMSPSAVSQQIRQLERETRLSLLHRTTRRLALTEAGQVFYEGCAAMLAAARAAEQRLAELRDAPAGVLSLSAPVGLAAQHLTNALAPLLSAHRQLSLRLVVIDGPPPIIDLRIDLAICIGPLPASNFAVHHLADWRWLACAAPAYLTRHGTPASPQELAEHDWLTQEGRWRGAEEWIGPDGRRERIKPKARITSNNQLSLKQLALAGFGVSLQVLPEIAEELAAGSLVQVLPSWSLAPMPVNVVLPPRARRPAKVRYALEALTDYFDKSTRRAGLVVARAGIRVS